MPARVLSPELEGDTAEKAAETGSKRQKTKHNKDALDAEDAPKRRSRKQNTNTAGAARDNKKHAADVLASVGGAGGDEGDDEDDYESESSGTYRPMKEKDGDVDMNGPEAGDNPEAEAEEEEDIVASLYDDEGDGDDKLYKKLLLVVQDLAKDHKLLHEKIEKLTARLDQKEAGARKAGGARKAADVDVEMAPPTTKESKKPKKKTIEWKQDKMDERPAGRRAQNPTRLLLLGYIRQAILALLGRKNRKEPLPDGPPDNIASPTEAMFYVKWTEREKSVFNKVAANIVASKVIKDWPDLCSEDDRDSLHAMATQHIRYLIKLYKRQRLPTDDPEERARRLRCSADTRKRTLFEQRLKTVTVVPGLQEHRQLVIELGIQGTSSDEEDPNNRGRYLVNRRKEFSNELSEFKEKVDYIYKTHYKTYGSRGSPARHRVPSGKASTRKFQIKQLPKSIMSKKWLSTLTPNQIALYDFTDYKYDFSRFPDELCAPST
ncbi:hypothetical protein FRC07_002042 [Ceratobasidium sp. 392]|nr:hypothetical protein FRC07_002042 [Ceratobasidium sp. 392]